MNLIINGIVYDIYHDKQGQLPGYSVKISLTNELDSAVVTISSPLELDFKKYDIAIFESTKWLVSLKNKVRSGFEYIYTNTLVELTLYLEKIVLSPCSFTNSNDYLIRQIEKLFYKAEPLREGETPRFKLSSNLITFLSNPVKPGEDFVYNERMTLREILDDMLSAYGVRCYVEDITDNFSEITIGYLDLNKKSTDVKELTRVLHEEENDSALNYADQFDVKVKNTQSKNKLSVFHDWQTLKPVSSDTVDNSSVKLVVDHPIEELLQVDVSYLATITYRKDGSAGDPWEDYPFNYDIVNLFVEQELYNAMSKTEQEKHIPYSRGQSAIGVMDTYKPFLFTYLKLRDYLMTRSTTIATNALQNFLGGVITNVVVAVPNANQLIEKVLFRVRYYPRLDFHFLQSKQGKTVNKKITSVLNQTDRSVDIDRYASSIRSLANLAGNNDKIVETDMKNRSQMLSLGQRIEYDYSLVSREYIVFKDYITCRYSFSQNYQANISARLSRERRLYNIPVEGLVDRSLIIKDNLLLSTSPIQTYAGDSHLNEEAITYLINSFNLEDPEDRYINRLLVQTQMYGGGVYPLGTYYSLNFVGRIIDRSIIWRAKMQDNFSVGLSTGKRVVGGKEVYLNRYVNDEGEAETITFRFIDTNLNSLAFSDQLSIGTALPLILSHYLSDYIKGNSFSIPTSSFKYVLKKDRLEALSNISYQLEANSINCNIIIGPLFMKYLKLLEGRDRSELRIWVSLSTEDTYENGDTLCKGTLTVHKPLLEVGVNSRLYTDYGLLSSMYAWAIGTATGRLLVAVNNNKQADFNSIYIGVSRN